MNEQDKPFISGVFMSDVRAPRQCAGGDGAIADGFTTSDGLAWHKQCIPLGTYTVPDFHIHLGNPCSHCGLERNLETQEPQEG